MLVAATGPGHYHVRTFPVSDVCLNPFKEKFRAISYSAARQLRRLLAMFCVLLPITVHAGPTIAPGDLALRHDIQVLADYGIIKGPVSTWPLNWAAIAADIEGVRNRGSMPSSVESTLYRVERRLRQSTQTNKPLFSAGLSAAEDPVRIRSFQNTPREKAELSAGLLWSDSRFVVDLNVQGVDSPVDGDDVRADGSLLGVNLGNFTVAASTMERWWGPSWDGNLILSNNARPIPSLTINRDLTQAFENRFLKWIGPWDLSVIFGQLESERFVPDARFFGMRFNFRPVPSLEIGLSRTAQWCGEGRPCDFDTFTDLFLGRDNVGDAGITPENEPGNQLAGFDFRWSSRVFGTPMALYGQLIGEDEAGGFPSRSLGLGGAEISGLSANGKWSYRWYAELAGTSCDFIKDDIFDCAYNHGIYQTGYRYKGRPIGHGADNDAKIGSFGVVVVGEYDNQFRALIRVGKLNRAGGFDLRNTLTPIPLDLISLDLGYSWVMGKSRIELGAGLEDLEFVAAGSTTTDFRGYVQWRYNGQ